MLSFSGQSTRLDHDILDEVVKCSFASFTFRAKLQSFSPAFHLFAPRTFYRELSVVETTKYWNREVL